MSDKSSLSKNEYRATYVRSTDDQVMVQVAPFEFVAAPLVGLWEENENGKRRLRGLAIAKITDRKSLKAKNDQEDRKLDKRLHWRTIEQVDLTDLEYDELSKLRRALAEPEKYAGMDWSRVPQQGKSASDCGHQRLFVRRYWSNVRQRYVFRGDYMPEEDSGLEWDRGTEGRNRLRAAILETRLATANRLWAERKRELAK